MTIKVKVLVPFFDKHNGKKYVKGDIIEVSPGRYNEILQKGKLVEECVEEKRPLPKKEVKK
jgi:hypothetical protein